VQPTPQDHGSDGGIDDTVDNTIDGRDDVRRPDAPVQQSATPDLNVLDGLIERPPHEHVAVYEQVHAQLQHALSEIDDA
jgi:hypothetical protein